MSHPDIVKTMALIREDCEADVKRTDGTPVTGRALGEMFGNILAMIDALAKAVSVLAEERDRAIV